LQKTVSKMKHYDAYPKRSKS